MRKLFHFITNLPKHAVIALINIYQLTLSPDHSWLKARFPYGYCRHYPSCSEYSKQAIASRGLIKGAWLSIKRVASCNPFVKPKFDPIHNS